MSGGFGLEGRTIIVTGAAMGIGEGIARLLAGHGARVAIADRDLAAAEALAAQLPGAAAFAVELSDEAQIVATVAKVVAEMGTPWALVNNAGIQNRQLLLEGTAEEWDRNNAINARAPFLLTREVARAMIADPRDDARLRAEGRGRIVNVASCSLWGQAIFGLASYMGSKGALAALTKASALELAEHAITVNTVLPGGVGTPGSMNATGAEPRGPARRMPALGFCTPEDIAGAVAYFVSPVARYTTNQTICVDAGWSVT